MIKRAILAAVTGVALLIALGACSSEDAVPVISQPTPTNQINVPAQDIVNASKNHVHEEVAARDLFPEVAGHTAADGTQTLVVLPAGDLPPVIVNVWFDEAGMWPKQVSVPANRQVQLVLRNYDRVEHHYHILGMPTVGMLWLSKEGEVSSVSDVSEEEHAMHHPEVNMMPFHICTSRSGICPTGQWIHTHADPADMDVVVFVTETPGSYLVTDPLHPEHTAVFHVF